MIYVFAFLVANFLIVIGKELFSLMLFPLVRIAVATSELEVFKEIVPATFDFIERRVSSKMVPDSPRLDSRLLLDIFSISSSGVAFLIEQVIVFSSVVSSFQTYPSFSLAFT